jgi:hypothetical protein
MHVNVEPGGGECEKPGRLRVRSALSFSGDAERNRS